MKETPGAVVLIDHLANDPDNILSGMEEKGYTFASKAIFSTLLSSGLLPDEVSSARRFLLLCSLLSEREDILRLQEDIRRGRRKGAIVALFEDEISLPCFENFFEGKEDLIKYTYCTGIIPRELDALIEQFKNCLLADDSKEAGLFNELVQIYINELTALMRFHERYLFNAFLEAHNDRWEDDLSDIFDIAANGSFIRGIMNKIRYQDLFLLVGAYVELYNIERKEVFRRVAERWREKRS
ncbi:hypothetical protein HF329_15025 [Chitinophaga oryzae]|uniref:Uncharacterized protein n=1 Tax=Chitinophaga oryzae TaxID=2725414 RepID=A0AAE7D8A8_9BACT|nr:hypothetical protein [Chitinophaga oryzae]QJB32564.1 hypothetical protein HF329_15025 [Chitinophaga oryzae]